MRPSVVLLLSSAAAAAAAASPPLDAFCGTCVWEGQHYDCNHRIQWLEETYGMSEEASKLDALGKGECVDPSYEDSPAPEAVEGLQQSSEPASVVSGEESAPAVAEEQTVGPDLDESVGNASAEEASQPMIEQGATSEETPQLDAPAGDLPEASEPTIDTAPVADAPEAASSSTAAEGALPLEAFCHTCRWQDKPFTCDERVKDLVEHHGFTKEGAMGDVLGKGECVDPDYASSTAITEEEVGAPQPDAPAVEISPPLITAEVPEPKDQEPAAVLVGGALSPVLGSVATPRESAESHPNEVDGPESHCVGANCGTQEHDAFGVFMGIVAASGCLVWLYVNRRRWKPKGTSALEAEDEEARLQETEACLA